MRFQKQTKSINACHYREASPLINRIVDEAKPLLHVHLHVEELIPIYDSLLYHWKAAGKPRNVLTTLLEATAAAIAVKKNAKVGHSVLISKSYRCTLMMFLYKVLDEQSTFI